MSRIAFLRRWISLRIALFAVLFPLAACASVTPLRDAPRNVAPVAPVAGTLAPYRIQVGDVLEVKLLLNPELDEEAIVRPDGMISTAVAQDVLAFGLTPAELQKILNDRYRAHLSDPGVAVVVRTFAPNRIYVLGEVNSPGEYISVGPGLTLLQALARAGGVKNSAQTDHIVVLRRGSADKPEVYAADYDAATTGRDPSADVRLAAYDVVYVPRTGVAEAYLQYEQYIQQFLKPSVGLGFSYQLNPD